MDLQPEPPDFDAKVRKLGAKALAKLERAEINEPPPLWRPFIPALRRAYADICAYTCVRIPLVVGSAGVDHLLPKSRRPELAYEWSNYRLACGKMNARKNDLESVLDPFEIEDGWFALEFFGHQVRPAKGLHEPARGRVVETI
ncbi:MAG: hypothetical protein KC457_21405, partial [Myxococcales bacterium]|nr:hypothetical protein [Myxococcales bacterium]